MSTTPFGPHTPRGSAPGGPGAPGAPGGHDGYRSSDTPGNQTPWSRGPVPIAGSAADPGQNLGLIAVVGAIAVLSFGILGSAVGIIVGMESRKRSRQAGLPDNTMGRWGFFLGVGGLVLSVLMTAVLVGLFIVQVALMLSTFPFLFDV